MSLSMYQASVPVFVRNLRNMSAIMAKAAAHAESKKIENTVFTGARLAADMLPFTKQIQIATDMVKGCGARLAGVEVPVYEDTEITFADLQARITKTISFLESLKPAQIDGSEARTVTLKLGGKDTNFPGQPYLLNFVMPNFFFHLTIAYAILRHLGVEIGKMDFLGSFG